MIKITLSIFIIGIAVFSIVIKNEQQIKFVELQKCYREYHSLLVLNKQLKTKNYEQASFIKIEQDAKKNLNMIFPKHIEKL
jgi:Skp family chaperone for outer membrane proteins